MTGALPLDQLEAFLGDEIDHAPSHSVAILAGHYAIFTGGADATEGLDDGDDSPAGVGVAPADLVAFTRRTWQAGCDAVVSRPDRGARLMVLVDDVHGVRPALADRSTAERLGAELVSRYLARTPELPRYHGRVAADRGVGPEHILRQSDSRWIFAERELRAALVKHVQREVRVGSSQTPLRESADGSTITVTHPERGPYCLVHSGHTNCAGGVMELLAAVRRRGIRVLVTMVPLRCLGPVSVGTMLARELYPVADLRVVNIAIGDPATKAPAVVTRG